MNQGFLEGRRTGKSNAFALLSIHSGKVAKRSIYNKFRKHKKMELCHSGRQKAPENSEAEVSVHVAVREEEMSQHQSCVANSCAVY